MAAASLGCFTASIVVGVPAGPVQPVRWYVNVVEVDGSARAAPVTVQAPIADRDASTTADSLSRLISPLLAELPQCPESRRRPGRSQAPNGKPSGGPPG